MTDDQEPEVTRCGDLNAEDQDRLFRRYGLHLERVTNGSPIPGSFWGPPEAGLLGNRLYVRQDTPVHSMFHEAAHYICMDVGRRAVLDTDAGGEFEEEDAVCYLQILLADFLPGFSRGQMMQDMDAWGYTFRLGSASDWFHRDAEDAAQWLEVHGLIDRKAGPTWQLNQRIRPIT